MSLHMGHPYQVRYKTDHWSAQVKLLCGQGCGTVIAYWWPAKHVDVDASRAAIVEAQHASPEVSPFPCPGHRIVFKVPFVRGQDDVYALSRSWQARWDRVKRDWPGHVAETWQHFVTDRYGFQLPPGFRASLEMDGQSQSWKRRPTRPSRPDAPLGFTFRCPVCGATSKVDVPSECPPKKWCPLLLSAAMLPPPKKWWAWRAEGETEQEHTAG